ncbi:hypothetical protein DXG03_001937 [Asterophora parasitica]|uniref:FAD/NAD(P)-binding domain-containing protein n=1 Tax=Asterophora parasitica TaxID=117018 RepID=A0A9P7KGH8_9AGAR|nr:hypothetical protein DXG03_001937 [Asterophora parasitica]
MARKVKIAVVGSGLAGLTAAYLLAEPDTQDVDFEVHLFEKAPMLGMDCSSVSLPAAGVPNDSWRLDVPMRSFQGVVFREADFSYSFSLLTPPTSSQDMQINATMIYNGSSGIRGLSMPSILNEPYHLTKGQGYLVRAATRAWTLGLFVFITVHITICYLRMLFYALPFWRTGASETTTFEEWAAQTVPTGLVARWTGLDLAWKDYTHTVLLPLFSAVCTAPEEDVLRHPVEEFLVSRDAQDQNLAAIHCDTPQGTISHTGFHHIIFATQASRAIPLLSTYRDSLGRQDPKRQIVEAQLRCLQAFEYRDTIVVNHTDSTLLPDHPRDQRELNLICMDRDSQGKDTAKDDWSVTTVPSSYTMATHVLRPPKGYPKHLPAVYQTTNPIVPPMEDTILSVAKLERAVVTGKSKEALKGLYREEGRRFWQCASQGTYRLGELQGAGRLKDVGGPGLWICGSFAYAGIPLLEGCVVSARAVVEQGVRTSEGVESTLAPW